MGKFLTLLAGTLVLASCNQNPNCSSSPPDNEQNQLADSSCPDSSENTDIDLTAAPGTGEEVPTEALIFSASVEFSEFEREDEEKVYQAIEIIKKVVSSKEFRDRVLNHRFDGKYQFVDNKGYTNQEIYEILLEGKEYLKPEVDHEMDLELQLYYSWRNIVGYTYPDIMTIFMNRKFFDPYTPSQVAGNLFHEWTHKLGFDHDQAFSPSREASVPYALGYLIEELGKQYE